MALARPGMLVGCGALAACALFFLSFDAHWFPMILLVLGVIGVFLSFDYGRKPGEAAQAAPSAAPPPAAPAGDVELRDRLAELDQMLADRVVSAAEHRRKRQALLDAWGRPPS